MKPYHITSSNLMELIGMTSPDSPESSSFLPTRYEDQIGKFEASNYILPQMMVMVMNWQVKQDLVIIDSDDANFVTMNFQLKGKLVSDFQNIRPLQIVPNTHNLLCSNPAQHTHHIPAGQELEMLHISIEKDYFKQLIGSEDGWSENALTKLEKQDPFLGSNKDSTISPAMLYQIDGIRKNTSRGAVRNLQVQSRLFELMAMQLDQFRSNDIMIPDLKQDDVDKLYSLHSYLQNHFLEDLSLAKLARLSTLNEFKIKKGFKALFNTTVFNYIKHLKMQHATRLLHDNRQTVEETAYELGFEHAQHFSVAFKKYFGVSPSQWNLHRSLSITESRFD